MPNLRFHNRTGIMVTLSNNNKCAERNDPNREFNNGLVLSSEPLQDEQIFEVRIERKVPSWSGSIEIGVTVLDPATMELPSSATNLRRGSWVMSGTSILKDGKSIFDECINDLDELVEGDRVGVMKTSAGTIHFFINGVEQGAVTEMETIMPVYAVIDLYGKCTKVSIVDSPDASAASNAILASNHNEEAQAAAIVPNVNVADRLRFHNRCGLMVKLSNDNHTAERRQPFDEFNNGVVMTHRPLRNNELFQIQIDELIHKWSGSIEMGVTTHNPDTLDFPGTMTNMRSGTIMMSGCGILTNGKGSKREYGEFNLDELRAGDRIGLMRKSNSCLHYYINGMDQGVATVNVPPVVYGVVDLYGMTVKVSINDSLGNGAAASRGAHARMPLARYPSMVANLCSDALLFSKRCGSHVSVINGGRTAIRPNCLEDFNHAVVLTNRPLRPDEFFEVLIEQVVATWAGSIEIGVTTHSPQDLEFPSTMTDIQSGTWMMTGSGIMHNGNTTIDVYRHSLDKLKAGDRIGLVVSRHGKLNFFVNGVDQGPAATNIPSGVYGVIDLYGQAAKASIISSRSPLDEVSSSSYNHQSYRRGQSSGVRPYSIHLGKEAVGMLNESFKNGNASKDRDGMMQYFQEEGSPFVGSPGDPSYAFHHICGRNIKFKNGKNLALRSSSFDQGILFSSKPLEEEGLFEVQLVTVSAQWHGSLIFGLTDYEPLYQSMLPGCALKLQGYNTWVLFGEDFCCNGKVVKKKYAPGLLSAGAGDKIGLRKDKSGNLFFSLNGQEFGIAATKLPQNLYVVCDLFSIAESVRISQSSLPVQPLPKEDSLVFHIRHSRNIKLTNVRQCARRIRGHHHSVVVTNRSLKPGELFEVHIDALDTRWLHSLRIGMTNRNPTKWYHSISNLPNDECSWMIVDDRVYHKKQVIKTGYGPNLNTLKVGQKVGLKLEENKKLSMYVDGINQGVAAEDVPFPCYCLVDLFEQCSQISFPDAKSLEEAEEEGNKEKADLENGIKEYICKPIDTIEKTVPSCEFQNACTRIKSLLFPDEFFLMDQVACFCDICHKLRGDEPYFKKGSPPKDYSQPFGWCWFGLRSPDVDKNIQETWHVAFHGTKLAHVRKILDSQSLLPEEKLGLKCCLPSATSQNEKETASSHVLMSPTIRYAGCSTFAPKAKITDPETKKSLHFHVAFQAYVRPGCYTIAAQRLSTRDPVDSHFSNSDLEWYTKEEGSTVLNGLLIKLADS